MITILLTNLSKGPLPPIVLLREHHEHTAESHAQRVFNREIIEKNYKQGDIILVEEDERKSLEELVINQLPGLDRQKYRVEGWLCKEVAQKMENLMASLALIEQAELIKDFPKIYPRQQRLEYYTLMHDFSKSLAFHPDYKRLHPEYLELSRKTLIFKETEKALFANCALAKKWQKYLFGVENFDSSQAHLIERVQRLQATTDSTSDSRIFVVMGANHGRRRHLRQLKIPYIEIYHMKKRAKLHNSFLSKCLESALSIFKTHLT